MSNFHEISTLMDEARFWRLVEDALNIAKKDSHHYEEQQEPQAQALQEALSKLDWQDILAWRNRYDALHDQAYRDDIWCAAYIMCGGCSDDGFIDFRAWLISRGRDFYAKVLADPDSLADVADPEDDYYSFEDFPYQAGHAFENKTGEDIYAYLPQTTTTDIDFRWDEDDPASMKALCPRLMAKCWSED